MAGLKSRELKIFRLLHKKYPNMTPNKALTTSWLMNTLAFSSSSAMKLYTLWFLNYQSDGDYSKLEKVNRNLHPVLSILKQIQSGELHEDDIPEKYYEEPISFCNSTGYYGERNVPCVSLDSSEVTLKLEREQWEPTNISGLHEEDLWRYYEATDSYGSDHYEEYEDEEFNYATFTDKAIELISQIALHSNRRDIVDYLSGDNVEGEKVVEYMSDLLPLKEFDEIKDEWLTDVGYETTRVRNNATEKAYNEEIKYNVSRGGNAYEIEIPMDEFIAIVEEENPLNFAEFLEMVINPEVDLESIYFDEGYHSSDFTEHNENMERSLDKLVEEYSDGSLEEYHSRLMEFRKFLDSVGITLLHHHYRNGDLYSSKDERLQFYETKLDILKDKIEFTYDGKKHMTSLDEFVNWAQGSVLPLQYESRKFIKRVLKQFILKS